MTRVVKIYTLAISAALVQGCGNGDGDAVRQFTSWDDVNPGETVVIDGEVVHAEYEIDLNSGVTTADPTQRDEAEARVTYDNALDLESVSIDVASGGIAAGGGSDPDVEFDKNDGDDIGLVVAGLVGGAVSASGNEIGLWAEPAGLGFNYQTFGVWLTGYNTGAGVVAAGSFGAPTPAAAVPTMNMATYNGGASGFAVDAAGTPFLVVSDAQVALNFGAGTFTFATTNSAKDNLVDAAELFFVGDANFNLNGNGNIMGNSLVGNVAAGYNMAGDLEGWLYGPAGEEVGGLFDLAGPAGRYAGSFGAVD